jgi:hypothetical protein
VAVVWDVAPVALMVEAVRSGMSVSTEPWYLKLWCAYRYWYAALIEKSKYKKG